MGFPGFRLTGRFATTTRPADRPPTVEGDTWAVDKVGGVGGTEIDATWINRVKAALEAVVTVLGGNLNDGDNQIANAIAAALALKSNSGHDHDDRYSQTSEIDAALALKAALASPMFTGNPTAPTPPDGDASTSLATTQYIDRLRGVASGLATLAGDGKLQSSQLPASVLGGNSYQGTWDATANSPALETGVGTKGFYYIVDTDGATDLDGITDWKIGDWAVFNGTAWEKVDNTDAVASVAGLVGAITSAALKTALGLGKGDVGLGNVDNTSDTSKPISTAQQTALDAKAPLASPALTGAPTAPTPSPGDASTKIATTEFVQGAVSGGDSQLQEYAESSEQTITIGSNATFAHGLGASPKLGAIVFRCKTAELGYSVGDEVIATSGALIDGSTSGSRGVSLCVDDTNAVLTYGATSVILQNKATGAGAVITPGSWKCLIRVWG